MIIRAEPRKFGEDQNMERNKEHPENYKTGWGDPNSKPIEDVLMWMTLLQMEDDIRPWQWEDQNDKKEDY